MFDKKQMARLNELSRIPFHERTPDEIVERACLNPTGRANFVPTIIGNAYITRVVLDMRERIERLEFERTDIVALKKRIEKLEKGDIK